MKDLNVFRIVVYHSISNMKKKFIILATISLLVLTQTFAQKKGAKDPVLLKFDKESVTKSEFERVYQKNNGGYTVAATHTPAQFREYLNLYINFKRKVFEAEEAGLDKTPSFLTEYNNYKKQLAQPYLSAKEVEERLIQEAFQRSKYTMNASHLLLMLDENAAPEDTLAVYNKIMSYRDSVLKFGQNFEEMAQKYSQDPSAKDNKGNLGYFNVFDMVYPFESAVYNTAVGQISMPVRTKFGYHILKVNDKISVEGTKRASHIIIRIGDRYSAKDSVEAEAKIKEIYGKLKSGSDFAELAKQYSDDPSTASKGGDLGTTRLLPALEERKLKLAQAQYTEPFKTQFGWHILKVTEVATPTTIESARNDLKRRIERDTRSQISKQSLIVKLKKENNFALNKANASKFRQNVGQNFPAGAWNKSEYKDSADFKLELFRLADAKGKVTLSRNLQDFVNYYTKTHPRFNKMTPEQAVDAAISQFADQELLAFEEERLPEKNPDYKALLREYRDGILLFTLMEQKVWKKAVEDSVGLKAFYETNKAQFQANEMVDAIEFRTIDENIIKEVERLLKEGNAPKVVDSTINATASSTLKIRRTVQTYEKGKNEAATNVFTMNVGDRSEIVKDNEFYKIYVVEKKYPAGIKPFEKAKSECITKYQDNLEKTWLQSLEKKYPAKVDEKVFGNLYKK